MTRDSYITRLAVLIATGRDDTTASDAEYQEAVEFLRRAEIQVPARAAANRLM